MPKTIKLKPHLSTEDLGDRYRKAKDRVLRSHYQLIWLISTGKRTAEVMEATGYCRGWIQRIARRYNEGGSEALGDRRHENPGAKDRALLDEEGRRELSLALGERPSDGGMWNSRKVAEWIEARTGKPVSKQRGWEYLRKLGNTPKAPRPRHKNADAREQAAFKKSSR